MKPLRRCLPLLLLSLGCSDPASPEAVPSLEPLLGTWAYLRSCGGIAPHCFGEPGGGRLDFIDPDSMIGRDGSTVLFAYRARLTADANTMYGPYPSLDVYVEEAEEWVPYYTVLHVSADSLELGDNAADGFTSYFRRLSD